MNLEPFMFMKPLADVISNTIQLKGLSDTINVILFGVDIFILIGIIAAIVLTIWGFAMYHFNKIRPDDGLTDQRELLRNQKLKIKKIFTSAIILAIIFICIPTIVTIISAIINSTVK